MKKLHKILMLMPVLLALLLVGCSLDAPSDPTDTVNSAVPTEATSQFVAVGNSLTAGYMDSGLMKTGQANSFPMLVATQMGLDNSSFTQPWVKSPGIGSTDLHDDTLVAGVLHYTGSTVLPLGQTLKDEVPSKLLLAAAQLTPYHNLGVPGALTYELMNTHSPETSVGAAFDSPNPFFGFINRSGALFGNASIPADPETQAPAYETASQFGQALAKGAVLTSVFIGGNDFLRAATSGEPIGHPALTDPTDWATYYGTFVGGYAGGINKRNGFKSDIIVTTLPNVANIPYFLDIADFSAVFESQVTWDKEETGVEYVLITDFLSWFMDNLGGTIPAAMTLDAGEVTFLDGRINAYNGAIQATIANPQVAAMAYFGVIDINEALSALDAEKTQHFLYLRAIHANESIAATAARTYFSLDGVHPNNKGYAFLANEFLTVANGFAHRDNNYPLIPLAAITWDPTYGVPVAADKANSTAWPVLSPEVAQGLKELWR